MLNKRLTPGNTFRMLGGPFGMLSHWGQNQGQLHARHCITALVQYCHFIFLKIKTH